MNENENAADVNDVEPEAPQEDTSAQDTADDFDIDEILDEFEAETVPQAAEQPAPETKTPADGSDGQTTEIFDELRNFIAETKEEKKAASEAEAAKQHREDLDSVVKSVGADTGENPKMVEAYINMEVAGNPKMLAAWNQRGSNPAAFKKLVSALTKKFADDRSGKVDQSATEDREAVAAAVRSASPKTQEGGEAAPDLGSMPSGQARAEIEKRWGYTPNF